MLTPYFFACSHDLHVKKGILRLVSRYIVIFYEGCNWFASANLPSTSPAPRSKHWHLVDYVITSVRDITDVRVTKTLSKLNFRIQNPRRPQKQKSLKMLHVSQFEGKNRAEEFSKKISSELNNSDPMENCCVEENWLSFRDTVHCFALEFLEPACQSNYYFLNAFLRLSPNTPTM